MLFRLYPAAQKQGGHAKQAEGGRRRLRYRVPLKIQLGKPQEGSSGVGSLGIHGEGKGFPALTVTGVLKLAS